ncbi:MAG: hypothetical protein MHM6MM_004276 [Cercozoa sp. M6MM]
MMQRRGAALLRLWLVVLCAAGFSGILEFASVSALAITRATAAFNGTHEWVELTFDADVPPDKQISNVLDTNSFYLQPANSSFPLATVGVAWLNSTLLRLTWSDNFDRRLFLGETQFVYSALGIVSPVLSGVLSTQDAPALVSATCVVDQLEIVFDKASNTPSIEDANEIMTPKSQTRYFHFGEHSIAWSNETLLLLSFFDLRTTMLLCDGSETLVFAENVVQTMDLTSPSMSASEMQIQGSLTALTAGPVINGITPSASLSNYFTIVFDRNMEQIDFVGVPLDDVFRFPSSSDTAADKGRFGEEANATWASNTELLVYVGAGRLVQDFIQCRGTYPLLEAGSPVGNYACRGRGTDSANLLIPALLARPTPTLLEVKAIPYLTEDDAIYQRMYTEDRSLWPRGHIIFTFSEATSMPNGLEGIPFQYVSFSSNGQDCVVGSLVFYEWEAPGIRLIANIIDDAGRSCQPDVSLALIDDPGSALSLTSLDGTSQAATMLEATITGQFHPPVLTSAERYFQAFTMDPDIDTALRTVPAEILVFRFSVLPYFNVVNQTRFAVSMLIQVVDQLENPVVSFPLAIPHAEASWVLESFDNPAVVVESSNYTEGLKANDSSLRYAQVRPNVTLVDFSNGSAALMAEDSTAVQFFETGVRGTEISPVGIDTVIFGSFSSSIDFALILFNRSLEASRMSSFELTGLNNSLEFSDSSIAWGGESSVSSCWM